MKIVSMGNFEPDEAQRLPIPANHHNQEWEFLDFCLMQQMDTLWFEEAMRKMEQLKGEENGQRNQSETLRRQPRL